MIIATSCYYEDDPGPKQNDIRTYSLANFNRLEIGDAFVVTVRKGLVYSVIAECDRRNLDDLQIFISGSSLVARYDEVRNRQYHTYITITLPELTAVNFSGAVNATVSDFNATRFDAVLSGASLAQMNIQSTEMFVNISGASQLRLTGEGEKIEGIVSGASLVDTFNYPVRSVKLTVSGASSGKITVSELLRGDVSGASVIVYRGNPSVETSVSGSSIVRKD